MSNCKQSSLVTIPIAIKKQREIMIVQKWHLERLSIETEQLVVYQLFFINLKKIDLNIHIKFYCHFFGKDVETIMKFELYKQLENKKSFKRVQVCIYWSIYKIFNIE